MGEEEFNIQMLKGVGPARAKALNRIGIYTAYDLLTYFPRAYDDRREKKLLRDIEDGETVCCELLISSEPILSYIRKGMELVKLTAVDETGLVNITWFNQSWLKSSFHIGDQYIFYGKFSKKGNRLELNSPEFAPEEQEENTFLRLMPVYPLTMGLTQGYLCRLVKQVLEEYGDRQADVLPLEIRERYHLSSYAYALENIHFPKDEKALELSRKRLVFEEWYVFSCAQSFIRRTRDGMAGIRVPESNLEEFESRLPFTLTGAQKRAVSDLYLDMCSGKRPMSRLVQGDVGSGKTVVAAAGCWLAATAGYQCAVMAPTELLATQHFKTLNYLLKPFNFTVELLTGSMTSKQKKHVYDSLKSGETKVVIGTHALLTETVKFHNLCFLVVDEQHRFGVMQRASLARKGEGVHSLVMSATPIPRTLALMIYGDLDVSVIDELPPGRQTVETFSVKEKMRGRIQQFVRKTVEEGKQVYWVCPVVEDSYDRMELTSAVALAENLKNKVYPDLHVGLLHGKMKAKEKDAVMSAFSEGTIDILVSTTVIEVGVDVPNASLLVVENADRFGLAQLHQLRGRVGRGAVKSYCILFNHGNSELSDKRLKTMTETSNGFTIAETDLRLRGPGDFLGSRQHGLPVFKIADMATDIEVLSLAQQAAGETLQTDPELKNAKHALLKKRMESITDAFEGGLN